MSKRLHNPKSHAPALYIPCWLSQVSVTLISPGAKTLYGRLAQWSSSKGRVYRSSPDLALELGASARQIERYIKELKGLGLIGTFHPQAGGVNHFEFYDHPWMNEQINDNLCYEPNPPTDVSVPPDRCVGTPPTDVSVINKKEIKETKPLNPYVDLQSTAYWKSVLFMSWYSLYPNKQKPTVAYKAFLKLKPDEEFVRMIIADVSNRLENNWRGRPKDKIPHPSTYLNQREWEGDLYAPENNITQFPSKPKRYTMNELTDGLL